MKKVQLITSEEFRNSDLYQYIQKTLVAFEIQTTSESTNCHALILMTNTAESLSHQDMITTFHAESKPIVGFSESAKTIARVLKKQKPVIAVSVDDSENSALNKLGIDTEVCPVDDFITDRYTKILSSSFSARDSNLDDNAKKGLSRLCKELVEMC